MQTQSDATPQSTSHKDNFEEVGDSKEFIEERVLKIKLAVIDFTIKQQELTNKISTLQKDIELLSMKLDDTIQRQQKAIENEDYEEADALNSHLQQTKNLIGSKEAQIKRVEEEYMVLENKKSDKYKELCTMIQKSLDKVSTLMENQRDEMSQFEETEQNAIEQKKKRLHYESIRIEEIRKEIQGE